MKTRYKILSGVGIVLLLAVAALGFTLKRTTRKAIPSST